MDTTYNGLLTRGTYVVLRLDPVATFAPARDPEITALAAALPSKKYIGLIDDFSFIPRPQWDVCVVTQGLPTPNAERGVHEGMCTPIFPNTQHPQAREALHPSKDFPWQSCYHDSHPGSKSLAVSTVHGKNATGVRLSEEDIDRLNDYIIDDSYESRDASRQYEARTLAAEKETPDEGLKSVPAQTDEQVSAPGEVVDDRDGTDPYDNFSDVTSMRSSHDGLEVHREAEALHYALAAFAAGEPVDPSSIVTTMEVWLDLTFFDSHALPPAADFRAEVLEISQLYLKWKAKHDAAMEAIYPRVLAEEDACLETPARSPMTLVRLCHLVQTKVKAFGSTVSRLLRRKVRRHRQKDASEAES